MNAWEMRAAVSEAEKTIKSAEETSTEIARLIKGRMRSIRSACLLQDLKRELRDFDAKKCQWKEQK